MDLTARQAGIEEDRLGPLRLKRRSIQRAQGDRGAGAENARAQLRMMPQQQQLLVEEIWLEIAGGGKCWGAKRLKAPTATTHSNTVETAPSAKVSK
jgi:hypothetical protein